MNYEWSKNGVWFVKVKGDEYLKHDLISFSIIESRLVSDWVILKFCIFKLAIHFKIKMPKKILDSKRWAIHKGGEK